MGGHYGNIARVVDAGIAVVVDKIKVGRGGIERRHGGHLGGYAVTAGERQIVKQSVVVWGEKPVGGVDARVDSGDVAAQSLPAVDKHAAGTHSGL